MGTQGPGVPTPSLRGRSAEDFVSKLSQLLIRDAVRSCIYFFFKSYFEHDLKCHSSQVPHLSRPCSYISKRSLDFCLRGQIHVFPETCPCGRVIKGTPHPQKIVFFFRKVRRRENRVWHRWRQDSQLRHMSRDGSSLHPAYDRSLTASAPSDQP